MKKEKKNVRTGENLNTKNNFKNVLVTEETIM